MRPRAAQLGQALAGGNKDRGARHHEHEPARQGDRRRHPSGDRAQDEPAGQRDEVQDRDVAPHPAVADRESDIAQAHERDVGRHRRAEDQPTQDPCQSMRRRLFGRQVSGGDGTAPFARMRAILMAIPDIVEGIDPAGEQAEGGAGDNHARWHVVVAERARRAGRADDERVLDPLARASQRQQRLLPAARPPRRRDVGFWPGATRQRGDRGRTRAFRVPTHACRPGLDGLHERHDGFSASTQPDGEMSKLSAHSHSR